MTEDPGKVIRVTLSEATLRFMRSQVDAKNQRRGKPVRAKLVAISPDGILQFKSESITMDPGNKERWVNFVELVDWEEAMAQTDLSFFERANLAVFGDLKVSCSCPAFLYWGYEYIVSEYDARYEGEGGEDWEGKRGKENRPPVIRNPNLDGIVCKHLVAVLQILTFAVSKVASRMKELSKERDAQKVKEQPPVEEKPVEEKPAEDEATDEKGEGEEGEETEK